MSPIQINAFEFSELSQETGNDLNAAVVVESSDGDTLSDTGALAGDPVVAVGLNSLTADLVGDFDEGPLTALVIDGVLHDSALLNSIELL